MKNYGFIPPVITPEDYVLGGGQVPKIVLQKDGDWTKYLPDFEKQKRYGVDSYNCTAFGTLSALEMLKRRLFNKTVNYSDRALGIMAGTRPPGNNPHTVAEAARKLGLVKEALLPFDSKIKTTDDYYQPDPLPLEIITEGQKWLNLYDLKHEYVFTDVSNTPSKHQKIKEALQYSPLGVSVYAWKEREGKYYKEDSDIDNHWVVLYKMNDDGSYQIFDSYENETKTLEKGYNFYFCKRYYLAENVYKAADYELQMKGLLTTLKGLLEALRDLLWKRSQEPT